MFELEDIVEVININNLDISNNIAIGQQGKIIMIDKVSEKNKVYYTVDIPSTNQYRYVFGDCIMDHRMTFTEENLKLIKKKDGDKMSKKEQLLNELEQIKKEFKEKIENVQKQIEDEDNKKESWTPKYEERYHLIDKLGRANYTISRNNAYDKMRIKNLNCFKTQKEAERVAFEQLLHRKLKRFAFENNEEKIDWNNSGQAKFYFFYLNGEFEYNYDYLGNRGLVYFTSKKVLEKAIEEFKDDLIRYFTSDK